MGSGKGSGGGKEGDVRGGRKVGLGTAGGLEEGWMELGGGGG